MANPGDIVRPWDTLNADEKKLFSRLAEVYAGFSEYTDAQVGRIIDYLEKTRPAREHRRHLRRRQRRVRRGQPQRLGQREQVLQRLPGRAGREHEATSTCSADRTPTSTIPTGWAVAFSTPFKMFKRYSEYSGGTCDPLVISWPKGIKARGEVRNQYHHSTDIVPTILDICGLEMPKVYKGVEQYPLSGVSMRYTLRREARRADAEEAPVLRDARHPRHLGGWLEGRRRPRPDHRQGPLRQGRVGALPRRRGPLRVEGPGQGASREAAGADQGLVRGGRQEPGAAARRSHARWSSSASSGPPTSRRASATSTIPGTSPVPEGVAVNVRGRSYKILADVEITDPNCSGRDLRARLALRRPLAVHQGQEAVLRLQLPRHQAGAAVRLGRSSSPASTRSGWSSPERSAGQYHESVGHDQALRQRQGRGRRPDARRRSASSRCRATACASGATAATPSARSTSRPATFKGGTILGVGVTVEKAQYLDLEKLAAAAFAVD